MYCGKSGISVSNNFPLKYCGLQLEVSYGAVGTADSKTVLSVLSGKKPFKHQGDRFMHYVLQCTSSSHVECIDKRKMEGQEGFCVTVQVRHTEKEYQFDLLAVQ
jgi:hypothetical protein